jgi:hypothetical protein
VVVRFEPSRRTTVEVANPVPFTVRVKMPSPTFFAEGEIG